MKDLIIVVKNQLSRINSNLVLLFLVSLFSTFSYGFYLAGQYWVSLLSLVLVLLSTRFKEIESFSVTKDGIVARFNKIQEKISEVFKSDKPQKEKVEDMQRLIDEAFGLGYKAAGKKFNSVSNVKIFRDSKGNVTGYQYDEN